MRQRVAHLEFYREDLENYCMSRLCFCFEQRSADLLGIFDGFRRYGSQITLRNVSTMIWASMLLVAHAAMADQALRHARSYDQSRAVAITCTRTVHGRYHAWARPVL